MSDNADEALPPTDPTAADQPVPEMHNGVPIATPNGRIVRQAVADGYADGKKTDLFTSDKQEFRRIKDIKAVNGNVLLIVDAGINDPNQAVILGPSQRLLTPHEAIQRAIALNSMAALPNFNAADRNQIQDIVTATIMAAVEAREQQAKARGYSRAAILQGRARLKESMQAMLKKLSQAKLTSQQRGQLMECELMMKAINKLPC
jgi:hypothetical protein